MADGVFNIAKGAAIEKFRATNGKGIVLLLKANELEANLVDHDNLSTMLLAGNTEADFTGGINYARKTGITAIITIDDPNDKMDMSIPDQTWTTAGGTTSNTLTKLIVAYEETAADTGRIPLTHHDFPAVTDGSDLTAQFATAGFFRAS